MSWQTLQIQQTDLTHLADEPKSLADMQSYLADDTTNLADMQIVPAD